jgi:predicted transcriptional regulator
MDDKRKIGESAGIQPQPHADTALAERFVLAYNAVDRELRKLLEADKSRSFSNLLSQLVSNMPRWRTHEELLRLAADVRNLLVHGQDSRYGYPAVPTPRMVEDLEAVAGRLAAPERVVPRFQRTVTTVATGDSVDRVLRLVHEHSYSQFPVYCNSTLEGLLTENGITRWLARHVTGELSLVDLEDVSVEEILAEQEESTTIWKSVPRAMPVDELAGLFARERLLEAVLITEHGKAEEALLGIATRWDVIGLL